MNIMRRFLAPAAIFLTFGLSLTACGGGGSDAVPTEPTITRIDVTPQRMSLRIGATISLSASVTDDKGVAVATAVTWRSSNEAVVVIDGAMARAVAPGTADITANAGGVFSANAPVRVAAPTSGARLIQAALDAGALDANLALRYRVFELFGDSRLPFEFLGNTVRDEDNHTLAELAAGLKGLPVDDQEILGPFLVPPIYRDSWLGKRSTAAGTKARAFATPSPGEVPLCTGLLDDWASVDSTNFRVWYQHSFNAATATRISAAAETARIKLAALGLRLPLPDNAAPLRCNGGDGRMDLYLVQGDSTTAKWLGPSVVGGDVAEADDEALSAPVPTYIVFNITLLDFGKLESTVTHEYMHAVQASYRNWIGKQLAPGLREGFLNEATAEWAVDYVGFGTKLTFGEYLVERPEIPLWSEAKAPNEPEEEGVSRRKYGAYLFFQFATRFSDQQGTSYGGPAVVRALWEGIDAQPIKNVRSLDALDAALPRGLTATWGDFVVAMWNQAPFDVFQQLDGHTFHPPAREENVTLIQPTQVIKTPDDSSGADVAINELSARYERFRFKDDSVSSLTFYNGWTYALTEVDVPAQDRNYAPPVTVTGVGSSFAVVKATPMERSGRSLTALLKINGLWTKEDWTQQAVQFLCRDKRTEHLEEVVLIYGNGSFTTIRPPADDADNAKKPLLIGAFLGEAPSRFVASRMPCYQFAGSARGSTHVVQAGSNFTVTNYLDGTFRGAGIPSVDEYNGRERTTLVSVNFTAVDGTRRSRIQGTVASCSSRPFDEFSSLQPLAGLSETFSLGTNYRPGDPAELSYIGSGGTASFTLNNRCTGGRHIASPAPSAFAFNALLPSFGSLFQVDLAQRKLATIGIPGSMFFLGDFVEPLISHSSWCFVATREGEATPAGACPSSDKLP